MTSDERQVTSKTRRRRSVRVSARGVWNVLARPLSLVTLGFFHPFHSRRSDAAQPTLVAATLVAHGLPADFVQRLAAERQAVVNARDEMKAVDHAGVVSTAAIDRLMRAGMKEVKYLDAIVHITYARTADQRRAWESARTIERPKRRKKKPGDSPTPTAAVSPTAPAA